VFECGESIDDNQGLLTCRSPVNCLCRILVINQDGSINGVDQIIKSEEFN